MTDQPATTKGVELLIELIFNPFRVADCEFHSSVGFTHGYSYSVLSGQFFDFLTFRSGIRNK